MTLHELQFVVVEEPEQNSCVVFDIPSDNKTTLPLASGVPDVSSGTIAWARDCPAAACTGGSTLLPAAYSPPANP